MVQACGLPDLSFYMTFRNISVVTDFWPLTFTVSLTPNCKNSWPTKMGLKGTCPIIVVIIESGEALLGQIPRMNSKP